MRRSELEHVIRAAGSIVNSDELIVVGSQALLGQFENLTGLLAESREVDVYPADDPEKSIVIDGTIGELTFFDETFGYYAQGVGPDTVALAPGWRERAIVVCNDNTNGIRGVCLNPVDVAVGKTVAGRPKDYDFLVEMNRQGMLDLSEIEKLIHYLPPQTRSFRGGIGGAGTLGIG